jgi:hypothetical protein
MMCDEGENGVFSVGNRGGDSTELPIVAADIEMLGNNEAAVNAGELEFLRVGARPSGMEKGSADFGCLSVFYELVNGFMFGVDGGWTIVVECVFVSSVDVPDDNNLGVGERGLGDESVDFAG